MLNIIFKHLFISCLLLLLARESLTQGFTNINELPVNQLNRDSLNRVIENKRKLADSKSLAYLFAGIGEYFVLKDVLDSTIFFYQLADEEAYKAGDSLLYYFIQMKLGRAAIRARDMPLALDYYHKAEKYFFSNKVFDKLSHTYGSLSEIYYNMGDSISERKYLQLAINANEKGRDTLMGVILNYKNIQYFTKNSRYDEAINTLNKNLAIIETANSIRSNTKVYTMWSQLNLNMLGHCYYSLQQYPKALACFKKAMPFVNAMDKHGNENSVLYKEIIACYTQLGQKDSVLRYVQLMYDHAASIIYTLNPDKLMELSAKFEAEKSKSKSRHFNRKMKSSIYGQAIIALLS